MNLFFLDSQSSKKSTFEIRKTIQSNFVAEKEKLIKKFELSNSLKEISKSESEKKILKKTIKNIIKIIYRIKKPQRENTKK